MRSAGDRGQIDRRPRLGNAGEDAAALFLESRGYRILARNLRLARCEVDLVLAKGPHVVFCEVKTRRGGSLGRPEEAVNARKRERILKAAGAYLARHPAKGNVRFDVVSVTQCAAGQLDLHHIENAFRPW